jgi:hypothetical protein
MAILSPQFCRRDRSARIPEIEEGPTCAGPTALKIDCGLAPAVSMATISVSGRLNSYALATKDCLPNDYVSRLVDEKTPRRRNWSTIRTLFQHIPNRERRFQEALAEEIQRQNQDLSALSCLETDFQSISSLRCGTICLCDLGILLTWARHGRDKQLRPLIPFAVASCRQTNRYRRNSQMLASSV